VPTRVDRSTPPAATVYGFRPQASVAHPFADGGAGCRALAEVVWAVAGKAPARFKPRSDHPALLGRPRDFVVTVREIQLAARAAFVIPITGEIMRMLGLLPPPERFDLGDEREIVVREG
jgi:formyltetrahydrofolate synthetase